VEGSARNAEYFSYLADCGEACRVVIGDARQSLLVDDTQYGVFMLDAFSSDAIPIHLLTREALQLYLSKLAPGGVLGFHISNRHLDLEPILARLAENCGLVALVRRDRVDGTEPGKASSDWIAMARAPEELGGLTSDPNWRSARHTASTDLWTDDFSNILRLLVWRQ
jgi:hypothetical protein